jgi:DNA-binding NarL/FixJ family response regulator
VRTVAAGDTLLSPEVTKRVIDQFTRLPCHTTPPGFDELTAREQEIFRLVAEGLSNAEIAERLLITDSTVKSHITHVLSTLGLRDRVQLIVLAYQAGLVDTTRP